jgi:MFS family permease
MGIGNGLFSSPNNSSIMGSVPPDKLSTGSSMIASMRQIGMSSGTAIAGAIFTSRQATHLIEFTAQNPASTDLNKMALVAGYQDTLLVAAVICALAIIPSVMRGQPAPHPHLPHRETK